MTTLTLTDDYDDQITSSHVKGAIFIEIAHTSKPDGPTADVSLTPAKAHQHALHILELVREADEHYAAVR